MAGPLGLEPFVDQSRRDRALVVSLGVIACAVGYVGSAALLFGVDALDHGGAAGPRLVAGAVASLACWAAYTVAFVRGRGGPVTNVLVYPTATVTIVPVSIRWFVFGPAWEQLAERVGVTLVAPALLVDAAVLVVPGVLLCLVALAAWSSQLDEAGIRAWQRRHLSAEFREAFADDPDVDSDRDPDAGRDD